VIRRIPSGVWAFAVLKVVLHLSTTRLGHHRDELYFIAASKRLSFSYVDFQPVVPLLVRLERFVFGDSLLGLRLIPAVAGAASIVLAALIARELGGGRRAQVLAAFALLVVPLFVGMNAALNTVSIETPAWLLVVYVVARMLRTGDRRLWVALGAALALAVLVKFTVLAYVAALGIAILLSRLRRDLRTVWPWAGAALCLLVLSPVLVWQASNGFPAAEFALNQDTGGRVLGLSGRGGFVASLLVLPGPIVPLFVLVPGMMWLLRSPSFRTLGYVHAGALVILLAASGKGYYAAPALAALFAAGAVAIEGWTPRAHRWLAGGMVVNLLIPLIILLPVAPVSWLSASEDLNQATEMGERVGWEDLALTVSEIVG
jgi:4-amino-4-deoxy-L-arabinose transferase-like glycosyltransferase